MAKPDRHPSKRRTGEIPLRVLVDTCVWLDIAKDYRQKTFLGALEELVRVGKVELIVPQVVRDEFARTKTRIAEDSARGLSSVMKRVKEAVIQFGAEDQKASVLAQLNDIDHRAGTLGEAVNESIERIESLLGKGTVAKTTDALKVRAADRAISKQAGTIATGTRGLLSRKAARRSLRRRRFR